MRRSIRGVPGRPGRPGRAGDRSSLARVARPARPRRPGLHEHVTIRAMRRLFILLLCTVSLAAQTAPRPRAREAGIVVGVLPPGPLNAITDVAGVTVGHATLIRGENIRTGVTAIVPHGGNLF